MTLVLMVSSQAHWLVQTFRVAAAVQSVPFCIARGRQADWPPLSTLISEAPLLLDGTRIFYGPIAVIDRLEAATAQTTLFPNGNRGMPLALLTWADYVQSGHPGKAAEAAALIARQLDDGRSFLQGTLPGLADAAAYGALGGAAAPTQVGPMPSTVARWCDRIAAKLPDPAVRTEPLEPSALETPWRPEGRAQVQLADHPDIAAVCLKDRGDTADLLIQTAHEKALPLTCDRALLRQF